MTILFAILFCFSILFQGEGTRQIFPEEFVKSRPGKTSKPGSKREVYKSSAGKPLSGTKGSKAQSGDFVQLGLTVWRLRPARATDAGERIIVQHESGTIEWTPERIETDTLLKIGEKIRFSFESPREGYLYVIDREKYADGRMGDPFLIFPTTRTRGGDNKVLPGKVVEIPAQDDQPNFFTLRQSRMDQTGELLTVLVTDKPLEGLTIGSKALALTEEQVKAWEKSWGAQTEKFEMAGGKGKEWTRAEREAGADATRQLTQEDPAPQTIYRVSAKKGAPILVQVGLRYGRRR